MKPAARGPVGVTSRPARWLTSGWFSVLGVGLLVAGVLTVFGPAWRGEFLIWDDNISIFENPHLGGLSWARVQWAFLDSNQSFRFMPLGWLGYSAVFSVGGLNPAYFHAATLLVHTLNAVLLFFVLRLQLCVMWPGVDPGWRELGAWFATALWVFHPLRVEVVAWALTLTYELAWCGLILAWGALLKSWSTGRPGWLWAMVAAYTASLLTYPVGISAWLGFWILGLWLARQGGKPLVARWRTKLLILAVPGAVVTGVALWVRWHATGPWAAPQTLQGFGLPERVAQTAYAGAYYLWRPWFPVRLAPMYGSLLEVDPRATRFLVSGVALGIGSLVVWFGRKKWPGLAAWWWATAALAVPVVGLTEHPFFTSDRFTGLPSLVLVAGLAGLWCGIKFRAGRWLMAGVAGALLAGCVVLTSRQVPRWQSTDALFRFVAKITPDPAVRAECHLRQALVAEANGDYVTARLEGNEGLAIAPYQRTLRALASRLAAPPPSIPLGAGAQLKLARFALANNDPGTAEAHLVRALRLAPQLREARIRLGLLLIARGETREALGHFLWTNGSGSADLDQRFLEEAAAAAQQAGDRGLARAVHETLTRRTKRN